MDCERNFNFMLRWQCPIYNGGLCMIKFELYVNVSNSELFSIVVLLIVSDLRISTARNI